MQRNVSLPSGSNFLPLEERPVTTEVTSIDIEEVIRDCLLANQDGRIYENVENCFW